MQWNKVALIGVGLLGGSLGMALKQRRLAKSVVGFVRRRASMAECRKFKATDSATLDLHSAVENADLIVLCTPLSQMRALAEKMLSAVKKGAIVTDVGSVKGSVVKELEPIFSRAGAHFVGSHPMAGGEKMGVSAARSDLFRDAVCVVTPTSKTQRQALHKTESLWKSVGACVMRMSPETHDRLVSRSSHLPHIVAAELANYVLNSNPQTQQAALCANGFRDTTRIASGSPEMWRDISLANSRNLDFALRDFIKNLEQFRRALKSNRSTAISKFFQTAKNRRDRWAAHSTSSSLE